jgi:hypothetical protein
MIDVLSPLATPVPAMRDVTGSRMLTPQALVVHTTGRGIYVAAKKLGVTPLDWVLADYQTLGRNFPHYVLDTNGGLYQIAKESEMAWHCKITDLEHELYWDHSWRDKQNANALKMWDAKFPLTNPAAILDGRPNAVTIAVEMIPLQVRGPNGFLFTEQQRIGISNLADDISERWKRSPIRILTHEDLSPLTRWDAKGGWDPGVLRATPFCWPMPDQADFIS